MSLKPTPYFDSYEKEKSIQIGSLWEYRDGRTYYVTKIHDMSEIYSNMYHLHERSIEVEISKTLGQKFRDHSVRLSVRLQYFLDTFRLISSPE